MEMLRNTWYLGCWLAELSAKPLARTILGENLVFFQTKTGEAAALADRCAHRFAPLSGGKIVGESIRCPYHGLQFNTQGHCVLNPHPPHTFPDTMRIKRYPVLNRYGGLWVWMGEKEPDESLMPDLGLVGSSDGAYHTTQGVLKTAANYLLLVDNLLDLTHVPILHDGSIGNSAMIANVSYSSQRRGDTITQTRTFPQIMTAPFYQKLFPDYQTMTVDRTQVMHWMPPGNMLLTVIHNAPGKPDDHRTEVLGAHIITPETETTSHYFWSATGAFGLGRDEIDAMYAKVAIDVLDAEDGRMVEAQQKAMGTTDFMGLKPSILPTDAASVNARRIVAKLIREGQR